MPNATVRNRAVLRITWTKSGEVVARNHYGAAGGTYVHRDDDLITLHTYEQEK